MRDRVSWSIWKWLWKTAIVGSSQKREVLLSHWKWCSCKVKSINWGRKTYKDYDRLGVSKENYWDSYCCCKQITSSAAYTIQMCYLTVLGIGSPKWASQPKYRCGRACVPSGGSGGGSVLGLVQLLELDHIPWLLAPSIFKPATVRRVFHCVTLKLIPPPSAHFFGMISRSSKPEVQDSTETGRVNRIWLHLIKPSREIRGSNKSRSPTGLG